MQLLAAGVNQMVNSLYALFDVGIATMVYWTFGIYGNILVNTLLLYMSDILIQAISIAEKVRLPNRRTKWRRIEFEDVNNRVSRRIKYIYRNETLKKLLLGFIVFGPLNGILKRICYLHIKIQIGTATYESLAMVERCSWRDFTTNWKYSSNKCR